MGLRPKSSRPSERRTTSIRLTSDDEDRERSEETLVAEFDVVVHPLTVGPNPEFYRLSDGPIVSAPLAPVSLIDPDASVWMLATYEMGALDFLRVGAILRCERPPIAGVDFDGKPFTDAMWKHEQVKITGFSHTGRVFAVRRGVNGTKPGSHDHGCNWRLIGFEESKAR